MLLQRGILLLVDNIEMKGEISADKCMNRKVKVRIIKFHFQFFDCKRFFCMTQG